MFDIAASELLIIAVVALIVIGPERLPRVARTLGHLFGRMQRYVNDVKADIQREVELDELRKLKQTVEESARSIETSVNQELNVAREEVRDLEALVQAQEIVPLSRSETQAPPAAGADPVSVPVQANVDAAAGESVVQAAPPAAPSLAEGTRSADPKPS